METATNRTTHQPSTQLPSEYSSLSKISVVKRSGDRVDCSLQKVHSTLSRSARGLKMVDIGKIIDSLVPQIYNGITTEDLEELIILTVTPFLELDPEYSRLAARLVTQKIYHKVLKRSIEIEHAERVYLQSFTDSILRGCSAGILDKRLLDFDLGRLALAIQAGRDDLFEYTGIQVIYDRYLRKINGEVIELPQTFFMRIAMGLALNEHDKNERAIEFYEQLSSMVFMSSTPTLLHSGTMRPQLSSCYLSTVKDDLTHIFKCYGDNAQMSKFSGGLGTDWSNIRATGAQVKTVGMPSQGLVPFLKIANDVTSTISRSGSRRGAACAYLEVWHAEIEDFLDLRRNTGDERRRTHDMNTAAWVPDLFMKRVAADEQWSLFSPHEVPDLHGLYGKRFEDRYVEYEAQAAKGGFEIYQKVSAKELWRKMLTRLFETGHPWICFKDVCNLRSPQDHDGVVNSSNLCTEITLNTSAKETAVCNLGSINLARHVENGEMNYERLAATIKTAMRMLDNVVDINFYPTKEGEASNKRHRPVGLGLMGLQDALFKLDIAFGDSAAVEFCDRLMEFISYHAILSSSRLARERGAYASFAGSKWDRGIFPIDTIELVENERGQKIDVSRSSHMDWTPVRDHVKKYGMRNSNTMAIAPTATISNIVGCFPCIEPIYKNIYVKANMCGEFTVVNKYLVQDLKKLDLWNHDMVEKLKYFDGSIQQIDEIPDALKEKYKEAFEVSAETLIDLTAARGKWIDQSQSHNIFLRGTSGKRLSEIYQYAWQKGLKTTYYLRSLGATQIEKSTLDAKKYGFTQKRTYETARVGEASCGIDDPSCESCQ